jgi:hypothetical protein
MIRIEWNALRVGDHVLVHDDADLEMPLVRGEVTMLKTVPGANDVTIRMSPVGGATTVVHPRRLAVHLDPIDRAEDCWRCTTGVGNGRPPQLEAARAPANP